MIYRIKFVFPIQSINFSFRFYYRIRVPPKDGANINGLFLEGARWENSINSLVNPRLKELFFEMPVMHIKATTKDKQELRNMYECPVYRNR